MQRGRAFLRVVVAVLLVRGLVRVEEEVAVAELGRISSSPPLPWAAPRQPSQAELPSFLGRTHTERIKKSGMLSEDRDVGAM